MRWFGREPTRNPHGRLPVALSVPQLSVVVPAYNEEERLPRTLARLHEYYSAQEYPYDVIVVSGERDRLTHAGGTGRREPRR